MTREEAKSCIGTIEMLQRLAYSIHGVMDVIDADNCKKIIKALEQELSNSDESNKSETKIDCDNTYCNNCVNHKYCDYESNKSEIPTGSDDCISRQDVLSEIIRFSTEEGSSVECQQLYCDVNNMPSVTPQEPKPMVEIDLYSVIKQKYIEREVLDKIRSEIEQDAFKDVNGSKYIFVNRVNQILDKYKGESEG